jgi:tRNA A-37 threonylcarbamoyl transferase component Bud32
LNEFVTQIVDQPRLTQAQSRLAESLGETLAKVHGVGVSVGDAKPENFVSSEREIFIVDLEQAGKHGDYAWDIAELLFYAGHYSRSPTPTRGLKQFTESFTEGYLRKGRGADLKQAAGVRYAKAFSFWTPAPIILEITRTLQEAGKAG